MLGPCGGGGGRERGKGGRGEGGKGGRGRTKPAAYNSETIKNTEICWLVLRESYSN